MTRCIFLTAVLSSALFAAIPTCPAGLPIGNIRLDVRDANESTPLPLRAINKVGEGEEIDYAPVLRGQEKREGKVTLVLVPAGSALHKEERIVVLESKPADKPAHWTVPFRVSIAAFVYGPEGLDKGKVKHFLSKDDELLAQLADYAEKTEKTEALLQALASYSEQPTTGADLDATLRGFAGQYGVGMKLDRSQPADQQMMAVFSSVNPALSAYDPIAPQSSQRVAETAGLATAVATLFFGSPVGLAAGGAAMAMNLKMIVFPGSEFRSAFAQPSPSQSNTVSMCGKRDPAPGRTRVAYVWAIKIPDATTPDVAISGQNHLPAGQKTPVKIAASESDAKLIDRGHSWQLVAEDGITSSVQVHGLAEKHEMEIDLTKEKDLKPGRYDLRGMWDWQPLTIKGALYVDRLPTFDSARLTPDTHDLLMAHDGKRVIALEGADFEYVEKVALAKDGDRFDAPINVPFSLPRGPREGQQDRLEMQVDTGQLEPGRYSLLLVQQGGSTNHVGVEVLPAPPKIAALPLFVNQSEAEQPVTLHGANLGRIVRLEADGVKFTLGRTSPDGSRRAATVILPHDAELGQALDVRMYADGFANPLTYSGGLRVAGPRPRVSDSKLAVPAGLEVALKPHELPAGVFISTMLTVRNAGPNPTVRLECAGPDARAITISPRDSNAAARMQAVQADTLFVSFDPGAFPTGCEVNVVLERGEEGRSEPFRLGRVVRIPRIESFTLTDQAAGDGQYAGTLTGEDLEMIDKTGWDADHGIAVAAMPVPIAGDARKQLLKVILPWPSPAPHAPLFIWLRGDANGRATAVRY
ncbi:MAG TPA: hypothetical protein VFA04_20420 [Bryobacteraceae bacterium]|nr:hypothetical protein [Bryobacteraceae bacterium]